MANGEALGLGAQGVPMTRREALAAGAGAAVLGTLALETAHARTASAATHMLPSVVGMDALELSRAIRRREVSCVEVMGAHEGGLSEQSCGDLCDVRRRGASHPPHGHARSRCRARCAPCQASAPSGSP